MISNLADYFVAEQEYYLDKITYDRIDENSQVREHLLNCIDSVDVDIINENTVRVTVERALKFSPEEMFNLTISFGALLKFNEEKKADYDWEKIDLMEEFRENGQFVLSNLITRISLLIAEITSSFGQMPIISPPRISSKRG